jgi:hypothetical protein
MTYTQTYKGVLTFATQEERDAGLAAAQAYLDAEGYGTTLDLIYGAPMSDTKVTFDHANEFPASLYYEFEGALTRLAEYATRGCVTCTFELDGTSKMKICAGKRR